MAARMVAVVPGMVKYIIVRVAAHVSKMGIVTVTADKEKAVCYFSRPLFNNF